MRVSFLPQCKDPLSFFDWGCLGCQVNLCTESVHTGGNLKDIIAPSNHCFFSTFSVSGFHSAFTWFPSPCLHCHVSLQSLVLRTWEMTIEGEEMTQVMEGDAWASIKENQGWKGEEINNSWKRVMLLSPSWISLIRMMHTSLNWQRN